MTLDQTPSVIVRPKAEKSIARRHPWIFSGAVKTVRGSASPGDTVAVRSPDGRLLGWGALSPHSQIRVRLWSFGEDGLPNEAFMAQRLETAIRRRQSLPGVRQASARRLVNAESDGLPGLIVDQYGDWLVCQFLSAGAERRRAFFTDQLRRLLPVTGIYERSDADVRRKEGLPERTGVLWGEPPPDLLETDFGDMRLWVDLINGHKTGFYLDQCDNHVLAARYAKAADMLNCFCYTGAFSVRALMAGANSVVNLDASQPALDLAQRNIALNGLDAAAARQIAGNAFEIMRQMRDQQQRFDLIVLDPPKFIPSAGRMQKGARGYKDINLLAFSLLKPGGILFTFSCSGLLSADLFQKIVADAALDAGRRAAIIRKLAQAADHPVALTFPEGFYLKGLVCQVDP